MVQRSMYLFFLLAISCCSSLCCSFGRLFGSGTDRKSFMLLPNSQDLRVRAKPTTRVIPRGVCGPVAKYLPDPYATDIHDRRHST